MPGETAATLGALAFTGCAVVFAVLCAAAPSGNLLWLGLLVLCAVAAWGCWREALGRGE
jgi:hypothetical protein